MSFWNRKPKKVELSDHQIDFIVSRMGHSRLDSDARIIAAFEKDLKQLRVSLAQYIAEVIKLKRELTTPGDRLKERDAEYKDLLKQHFELVMRCAPQQSISIGPKPSQKQRDEQSLKSYMSLFEDLPVGHEDGYTDDELLLVKGGLSTDVQKQEEA